MARKIHREPVIDSRMSFPDAIAGTTAPPSVLADLCLLAVSYYAFDGALHQGQLVVHRRLRDELREVFAIIQGTRFPVAKVVPIVHYGWSDEASMADNNTSAFNYRTVAGSVRLSRHAAGMAIDVNPRQNPVIYADGRSLPPGASYLPRAGGALKRDSRIVREFLARGWQWGGDFADLQDYHHFDKKV